MHLKEIMIGLQSLYYIKRKNEYKSMELLLLNPSTLYL